MSNSMAGVFARAQTIVQKLTLAILVGAALALVGLSLTAAFGLMPWPEMALSFGGDPVVHAGMYAQLGLMALCVALLFFLPTNARIMQLELSHRSFQVRMEDVAAAYRAAHEDDRKKLFRIGSEFDSVRERLLHLRNHPDLGALEPEILELAAQMSHEARALADVYDDEKVERARIFLRQRQQEVEKVQENLSMARRSIDELRHWMLQVETEESVAAGQIKTLEADLFGLLPELGYDIGVEERPMDSDIVVPLATRSKQSKRAKTDVH